MSFRSSLAAASLAACAAGPACAALSFTDWTVVDTVTDRASGLVGAVAVTLSGTQINAGNTAGTSTVFSQAGIYTPALAQSDALELAGLGPASTFTLTFSSVVVDPLIHLGDLSSTITFASGSLSKVSGSATLTTSGNQIPCDGLGGTQSCRGTVRLGGLFNSITFTAFNAGGGDGFYFQIGFDPLAPVPEPAAWILMAAGLGVVGARARARARG